MTKNKILYENEVLKITVEESSDNTFIVKHGKKEMCPTEDRTLALIFAKGYERGFAEGKKDSE